jgi:hypothetical protein
MYVNNFNAVGLINDCGMMLFANTPPAGFFNCSVACVDRHAAESNALKSPAIVCAVGTKLIVFGGVVRVSVP